MTSVACAASEPSAGCAGLSRLRLPDTRIVGAEVVDGPNFTPPSPASPLARALRTQQDLPAFCRVSGVISPAIHFEVWLPLAKWNGKFQGAGNGGYNGSIVYDPLAAGVRRGYATSSTDMGHAATAPDPGSWAMGHPELVVDQGYRAQHETAVKSKQIIRAFYGTDPRRSYFTGCSSGGWQGLTEAQRFPHDYDGIISGAPAIDVVHLHAATLWNYEAMRKVAPGKFRAVTATVLARCDTNDGVEDGLLEDPRSCSFSPGELVCRAGQSTGICLTQEEAAAFQQVYDGVRFSSGEPIYPGWPRGLEYGLAGVPVPALIALGESTFKDLAFQDPSWDYRKIDYDRDVRAADAKVGAILNSTNPDLRAFRKAGGKLILYHGWDDPFISALNTLGYYQKMAAFMTGKGANETAAVAGVQDFVRLFMMPGVGHCAGGPGPDKMDALTALEKWVEEGVAPARITASHATNGTVDRTRPLCPYPQVAAYQGKGSSDDAGNFVCRAPERS